tara:strand:- start:324 stop:491 length:168 start_codon:yes stop_codon:yes gene_type:complete
MNKEISSIYERFVTPDLISCFAAINSCFGFSFGILYTISVNLSFGISGSGSGVVV